MKRIPVLICLCLFCFSCSKITILRTSELIEVQNRVDSLRNEIFTFELDRAKKEEDYRIVIELTLGKINETLMQLSGNVAESQTKISEITRRTSLISSQMAEKARQDSLVDAIKERERFDLFNLAKSNYDKGNLALAINDFNDYIEKYKDSEEAKDALYWMAEANYLANSLDNAKTLFQKYYKDNRTEKRACSALYKLGLIFDKQGQTKNRDKMWDLLAKECPSSEELKLLNENRKK